MTDITRRQFGANVGAGFFATSAASWLAPHEARAQGGAKRVTHAISAGDISSLDPTLAWVSAEVPINTVVMEGLVSYPPGTISTEFVPALAGTLDGFGGRPDLHVHAAQGRAMA